MAALGDIIYRGSSVWKRLVGNTSTRRQMLCQTGTGSASAAPTWVDTVIERATVTLTDAQVKALPTTPITIQAAPGSGVVLVPFLASVFAKTAAGAYTNIDAASDLAIEYGATGIAAFTYVPNDAGITNTAAATLSGLLGTTTNQHGLLIPFTHTENLNEWGAVPALADTSSLANASLVVTISNGSSGALTGGNAANALKVTLYFTVESVP